MIDIFSQKEAFSTSKVLDRWSQLAETLMKDLKSYQLCYVSMFAQLYISIGIFLNRAQSYDFDLQRQRCKFFTTPWGSLARFENRNILFYFEKLSSLQQRWRCSCKLKIRRIGSCSNPT
jgi:hypothetical protein